MQETQKYMIDTYMNAIYDAKPQGQLLERVKAFERRLVEFADANPNSMDVVGDSGLREEYNKLFTEAISGGSFQGGGNVQGGGSFQGGGQETPSVKLPTVHEFLDTYRHVYETSVSQYDRELTKKAYMELFDVENRTDNLMEAQLIIERENLILNTVTADYKNLVEDFLEAADPNYEVTSASVKNTLGVYASAQNLEEITYMGEVAQASCDDIAVQTRIKVGMFTNLTALILAWEYAKRRIREGHPKAAELAMRMVLTRKKLRAYYKFMSEDMGIGIDEIFTTPFYRIMLLNPQGLDGLWRIKKVMHPANLEATRYILQEEVLTEKTMEEILASPQKAPYYEMLDSNLYPRLDDEYERIAQELNKDIKYFNNDGGGRARTQEELIEKTKNMGLSIAKSNESQGQGSFGSLGGGNLKGSLSNAMPTSASTAKEVGKGILKGLFRR